MNTTSIVDCAQPTVVAKDISVVYQTEGGTADQYAQLSTFEKLKNKALGKTPKFPFTAVSSATFATYPGDSIGLIGPNGAGKSTLLRIIAGVETPASGTVWASSQPVLQGVSAALVPALSGEENARLGCLAMGLTPEQTEEAIPEIVEFSELGTAIKRPMKTYSSGMSARLRFAISTATTPEILLIDEALATGDGSFQEKSRDRMQSILCDAGTIFLVSHSIPTIRENCNRVIWLTNGRIVADGPTDDVMPLYSKWLSHAIRHRQDSMDYVVSEATKNFPPQKLVIHG